METGREGTYGQGSVGKYGQDGSSQAMHRMVKDANMDKREGSAMFIGNGVQTGMQDGE